MLPRRHALGIGLFVVTLLCLSTSCAPPLHVPWDDHQPVLTPQESQSLLQPQGRLLVYSERYDKPDEDSPILVRRPIHLFNDKGQFLEEYNDTPLNDDP